MDRRHSIFVVIALMTATFLTAMDIMVVGTAMPTIIGQLGGLSTYTWVFTAYLITSTVTVPIYGKLADLYGRLPVFYGGTAVFLVASALCGLAQSMEQLIAFRAIQGLGAGAVQPLVITMAGDIFTIEQRARFTSLFGAVWGFSSVAGPLIGGTLTEAVSWRWVFYVNIPIGIAACLLLARHYPERVPHRARYLDLPGAALLTAGLSGMLVAIAPGADGAIVVETALLLMVPSVALLAAFVVVERRAPEPMLPLSLLRIPAISVGAAVALLASAAQYGLTSFLPLWKQGVQGGSPTEAGLLLMPLSVTWPAGSFLGGRIIMRWGFRPCVLVGAACIFAGIVPFIWLNAAWPSALAAGLGAVVGLGLGFSSLATTVATQNSVGWQQRGVATSTNLFARSIGGGIGVTVLGTVLAGELASRLAALGAGDPEAGPAAVQRLASAVLDPIGRRALDQALLGRVQVALDQALGPVFLGAALFGAAACLLALRFPRVTAGGLATGQGEPPPHPVPAERR